MSFHYIKIPSGELYNLDKIFYISVEEDESPEYDHCVWAHVTNQGYNTQTKSNFFPGRALAWGSKNYCERIKDKIEVLLKQHQKLTEIEGENTLLQTTEDTDLEEEPKSPPPPKWFRNLPPNEEEPDDDIQL